jgi:hypothetical protein
VLGEGEFLRPVLQAAAQTQSENAVDEESRGAGIVRSIRAERA